MEETELCFPHLNTSCRKLKRPHSDTVLIYIILSCISLLTATLNLLVIISISHFRKLHTPSNILLLSLAVSDFFVGLLMFSQIMLIEGCWYLSDLMCVLYYVSNVIASSAAIGTMVLISIDRYVAVCYPLHYSTKITPKRTRICVSLCWICSLLFVGMLLRDNLKEPGRFNSCTGECVVAANFIEQVADLILTFIIPITVIVILYVRVFVVAVSHARTMRSHITAFNPQGSLNATVKKSEMKAARTLGVVVVAFLFCLCPYFCVTLTANDTVFNTSSAAIVICLFYFNSCLNPIIYAFFYPWCRKSFKLILTLKILKPGSCDTNIL
ncbi:trace amine-associated receptor 13c-like [Acanthochromis polyacanthus]|uniref:trace amine-associated receptor 13c-like n=1 Tax=Acanthochromis polyacanthus TaxID=80966 RepID=UPI002233FE8A|nr:trace amine-associated receptor 13c-like [Acanthochromis polyacanthus]